MNFYYVGNGIRDIHYYRTSGSSTRVGSATRHGRQHVHTHDDRVQYSNSLYNQYTLQHSTLILTFYLIHVPPCTFLLLPSANSSYMRSYHAAVLALCALYNNPNHQPLANHSATLRSQQCCGIIQHLLGDFLVSVPSKKKIELMSMNISSVCSLSEAGTYNFF